MFFVLLWSKLGDVKANIVFFEILNLPVYLNENDELFRIMAILWMLDKNGKYLPDMKTLEEQKHGFKREKILQKLNFDDLETLYRGLLKMKKK